MTGPLAGWMVLDLTQGTVSHHLRVLREAGLVNVTKRGLWHHYALVRDALVPLQSLLDDRSRQPR